ncbi:MAG: thermonuclease family protein [Deltaproteobacteria bacterium]|jgi:endonuclease YncB( thermonuclease family)|nr:thermonuclease family protein [Deltaproteobacteria bacterium]
MKSKYLLIITTLLLLVIKLNISCKKNAVVQKENTRKQETESRTDTTNLKLSKHRDKLHIKPGTRMKLKVIHVVDADTVYLLSDDGSVRVKGRLSGINSPECKKIQVKTLDGKRSARCKGDDEAYGYKSWLYLNNLIQGKEVEIDCDHHSNSSKCKSGYYNRSLITIYYKGENLNKKLVATGNAFTYTKYPSKERGEYCRAEFKARKQKKGMWSLAPSSKKVLSLMSHKTRKWYQKHDALCQLALSSKKSSN